MALGRGNVTSNGLASNPLAFFIFLPALLSRYVGTIFIQAPFTYSSLR